MKLEFKLFGTELDIKLRQPATFTLFSIAAIVAYFYSSFHDRFHDDGFHSSVAITSQSYQKYVMACLGGAIALLFSTIADFWGKFLLQERPDPKYATEFVIILAILLPSLFMVSDISSDRFVSFVWPLFHIQIIIILNVALAVWAEKMSLSLTSASVLGTSLLQSAAFTLHVFVPGPNWTSHSTEGSSVAFMCVYAAAFYAVLHCAYKTYRKDTNKGKDAVALIDTAAAQQQWALGIISVVSCFYIVFLVLEAGVYPAVDAMNLQSDYLSANYVLLSSTALVILTLHKRKELYHGVMSQTSLEIKRLFVRYVSHEIRTPMNTTLLGLNLLESELKTGLLDPSVLSEVVSDSTGSCTIAIGILNDLLLYEKIDGGLLTLEKEETSVWSFVEETLKVFLIQAKSSEVELAWPKRCIKGVHAEVDKNKISQVLRNLVSNALKFTPKGGKVRVTAEVLTPGAPARRPARNLDKLDELADENDEHSHHNNNNHHQDDIGNASNSISNRSSNLVGAVQALFSNINNPNNTSSSHSNLPYSSRHSSPANKNKAKPSVSNNTNNQSLDASDPLYPTNNNTSATGTNNNHYVLTTPSGRYTSMSGASEETPPHAQYTPVLNNNVFPYSPVKRQDLVPDSDLNSVEGNMPSTHSNQNNNNSSKAANTAAGEVPLFSTSNGSTDHHGADNIQGEEGTTKMNYLNTPTTGNRYAMSSSQDELHDLESGLAKPPQNNNANNNNVNNNNNSNPTNNSSKEQHLASAESSPESAPDDSGSGAFFAGKGGMQGLARRLFGGNSSTVNPTQRPSLQVFPTVSMVRISVTDSGAGISKENQEKLFKSIVQFNANKLQNGQGSGIGLWISSTIVRLHGGKIGVQSDGEGKGCTFYIDIPISKIDRGSNYRHTSPAHKDISSKFKYTSPDASPSSRERRRKSLGMHHLSPVPSPAMVPSYTSTVNNQNSNNNNTSYYQNNSGNNSVNGSLNSSIHGYPTNAATLHNVNISRSRSDSHEVPQLNTPHGNNYNNPNRAFISPDSHSYSDSDRMNGNNNIHQLVAGLTLQVPVGGGSTDSIGFSPSNSVHSGVHNNNNHTNNNSNSYQQHNTSGRNNSVYSGMYNTDTSTREMNASIQAATSALNVASTSHSGSTMTTDTGTTNDRSPHNYTHNRSGSSHNNSMYSLHSATTQLQQQQPVISDKVVGAYMDAPLYNNLHPAQLLAHHPGHSQAIVISDHLSLTQRPPAGPSAATAIANNTNHSYNTQGGGSVPTTSLPAAFVRNGSDQSIFTGGSSNRSNRSNHTRGSTSHSSFSSENDGMSSRTELHEDGSMRILNVPTMLFPEMPIRKLAALQNDENANIVNNNTLNTAYRNNNNSGYARVGTILEGEKEGENEKSSESGENEKSGDSGNYRHIANTMTNHNGIVNDHNGLMDNRSTVLDRLNTQQITQMQIQQQQQPHYQQQSTQAFQPSLQTHIPPQNTQSQITQTTQPPNNSSLFHKRALIVDDSAINRKFVNRLLRTKIGSRDEAEDGLQAVRMVQQSMEQGNEGYDVILMDYVMPVMDGPTATEKIRALGFKGVILGVTGNGHQPEIDFFIKSGANRVLIKPLSADQFYGILVEVLQEGQ